MNSTIKFDRNGYVKPLATVCRTWDAWNGPATVQELTWAINSQLADNEKLTQAQVLRAMRELGERVTPGSTSWKKVARWTPRHARHNPLWRPVRTPFSR